MSKNVCKCMITSLLCVILFMIAGCTETNSNNQATALSNDSTKIEVTREPTVVESKKEYKVTESPKIVPDKKTEELIDEIESYSPLVYTLFNYPSYYYDALQKRLDAFSEFLACKDYATVTLLSYIKHDFYKNKRQKNQSDKDWLAYDAKAVQQDNAIAFDEILLANNNTFAILTEEERLDVLNEVKEKLVLRTSGDYYASENSPFLFYVQEQNTAGNSNWYDYIMNSDDEYSKLKEILSDEILSFGHLYY